jgi:hypothetical protein
MAGDRVDRFNRIDLVQSGFVSPYATFAAWRNWRRHGGR